MWSCSSIIFKTVTSPPQLCVNELREWGMSLPFVQKRPFPLPPASQRGAQYTKGAAAGTDGQRDLAIPCVRPQGLPWQGAGRPRICC